MKYGKPVIYDPPVVMRNFLILLLLISLPLLAQNEVSRPGKADPALDSYYAANKLYNNRQYKLAVDLYREFLEKHPEHEKRPLAEMGLAVSLSALGNHAEAVTRLDALVKRSDIPNPFYLQWLRAESLLKLGKLPEAAAAYRAVATSTADPATRSKGSAGLLEALFLQKDWDTLSKAGPGQLGQITPGPAKTRATYQTAFALREADQLDAAALMLARAEFDDKEPMAPYLHFLNGEIAREQNQPAAALTAFRFCAAIDSPYRLQAEHQVGSLLLQQKQYKPAIEQFQTAIRRIAKDKSDMATEYKIRFDIGTARAYLATGEVNKVPRLLQPHLAHPQLGPEASLWLARAQSETGQMDVAAKTLTTAVAQADKSPLLSALLFDLGNLEMKRKNYPAAAQLYARHVQQFPRHPQRSDAMRQQAYALHLAKQYAESLQLCRTWLTANAKNKQADQMQFLLGENLFFTEGKESEADAAFTKLTADHPESDHVPLASFRKAQLAYRAKNWGECLTALKPLLDNPPTDKSLAQAEYLAGASAYQLKDWATAVKYFSSFLTGQPEAANRDLAQLSLALANERRQQAEQAITQLADFEAKNPKSPIKDQAMAELGRMQFEAGQLAPARTTLTRFETDYKQSPHRAQALYYLAWTDMKENKAETAATRFGQMATEFPEHDLAEDALLQQGIALAGLEKHAEASKSLTDFLTRFPDNPRRDHALYHAGVSQARQNQWTDAAKHLAALRREFPSSDLIPSALYEGAWCAKGLGDTNQTRVLYGELVDKHPSAELAEVGRFELGELEYQAGQLEAALPHFEALASARDPAVRTRALYRKSCALFDQKKYLDAATNFEAVLKSNPPKNILPDAAYQAGEARLKLREYTPALENLKLAWNSNPADSLKPNLLLRLARAQALTEGWVDSEKSYQLFLKDYPEHPLIGLAWHGLGWAQENQSRHDEAIQSYGKVVAIGRKDETAAQSQFQIGECHFNAGRLEEAVKAFVKVQVGFGFPRWSSMSLLEMGRALEKLEDKNSARETWEELLKEYPDSDAAVEARKRLAGLGAAQPKK